LSDAQKTFFDFSGNGDGSYDVGDFRAYLLANPNLPESAVLVRSLRITVPLGGVEWSREPDPVGTEGR
jgi:hypothetical protein